MKKILLLSLILCLCLSISSIAYADTNSDAQNSHISATFEDSLGNKIDIPYEVTITEVPTLRLLSSEPKEGDIVKTYQIKVATDSDALNETGMKASATLSMTWDDVFGTANKITNISGSCSCTKGTYNYVDYYYGDYQSSLNATNGTRTYSTSFYKNVNFTSTSSIGTVRADAYFNFKSTSNEKYKIELHV